MQYFINIEPFVAPEPALRYIVSGPARANISFMDKFLFIKFQVSV